MLRPPPRSPLFPYTTLFRSRTYSAVRSGLRAAAIDRVVARRCCQASHRPPPAAACQRSEDSPRSEEHTSELQSLTNLVCRLLLEKKNNARIRTADDVAIIME